MVRIRQVVTGHDTKGRAVFPRDEQVDATPIPGLGELAFLWSADEPSKLMNPERMVRAFWVGLLAFIVGPMWFLTMFSVGGKHYNVAGPFPTQTDCEYKMYEIQAQHPTWPLRCEEE